MAFLCRPYGTGIACVLFFPSTSVLGFPVPSLRDWVPHCATTDWPSLNKFAARHGQSRHYGFPVPSLRDWDCLRVVFSQHFRAGLSCSVPAGLGSALCDHRLAFFEQICCTSRTESSLWLSCAVPTGLGLLACCFFPALPCWAFLFRPCGTGFRI